MYGEPTDKKAALHHISAPGSRRYTAAATLVSNEGIFALPWITGHRVPGSKPMSCQYLTASEGSELDGLG